MAPQRPADHPAASLAAPLNPLTAGIDVSNDRRCPGANVHGGQLDCDPSQTLPGN